jgi:hypothetical protein
MGIKEFAQHPMTFGAGAGVANGVLAAVRNKPVSPNAAIITSLVVALGEAALVYEVPKDQREPLLDLGIKSLVGTFIGLAPFVSWEPGQKSAVQRSGEYLGDKLGGTTEKLLALKRSTKLG